MIAATCPDSCQYKRDADGPNGCFADCGITGAESTATWRTTSAVTYRTVSMRLKSVFFFAHGSSPAK